MAVYLDNSATTKPCREATEAVQYMITENYGNPSSLHAAGIEAAKSLISAREAVARALGCEKEELYFTSGATEANNLALFGAAGQSGAPGTGSLPQQSSMKASPLRRTSWKSRALR